MSDGQKSDFEFEEGRLVQEIKIQPEGAVVAKVALDYYRNELYGV
jgi:hypothetical protein